MDNIGIASVAAITVTCYLVGLCVKAVPNMADKYIPICCGVAGAALGVAGLYLGLPDFPAHDLAVGIVSGLAATGANQVFKQLGK